MSTRSSLDRESFQKLLASAFSMQESGVDAQSLPALLELEKAIATGEPDVDRAMQLVADRARNVANASGIAIAVRRGDQLVYRAGSGCAGSYVGRHMTAILSVSAQQARGEILRVENAQTDARIEAAICRQFGAQSLLILPIYDECAMAGVLEVLFSEPHAFEDREMRTYRLMAGLLGEAISRDAQVDQRRDRVTKDATPPRTIEHIASGTQRSAVDDKSTPEPARNHEIRQVCGAGTIITERVKRVLFYRLVWNLAVTAVIAGLVIAVCRIANDRPASQSGSSSPKRSNTVQQQKPFVPAMMASSNQASKPKTAAGAAEEAKSPSYGFKRLQVGPNEIDYIAEDVTIRHFTAKPARPLVLSGYKEVHLGEDVTVRLLRPN
jgi:GAF domain